MSTCNFVAKALEIATRAHAGQTDKAGKPYIGHPVRVAGRVAGEVARAAAYLHDVMEDCGVTRADLLRDGIPAEVVDVVELLSRGEGETYGQFIERIALHPVATEVKLADIADNSDPDRIPPGHAMRARWEETLRSRYTPARERLERARAEHAGRAPAAP